MVESMHFCPETKQHLRQEYIDATDPNLGLPKLDSQLKEMPDRLLNITSSVYPTKDKNNNPLEPEFGLSTFKDHQTITLQEMPEKAPMGQLPRSVELIFDHDLVDKVKPGDRIMVVGVYRALATNSQGQQSSSGVFRTVVLVNNVQILGRDFSHLNFSAADIRAIRSLAKRDDILAVLGRSISPSIHGHSVIKKALALQLLSGVEKNLDNGTHLRGDINILMVGDPSTAKSQLLRAAMSIAPLAVSTTGKGSSGVGLTAAVTSDPETRERRLEAGAMVLADRGLVCVDEFDKMGEGDRVAIHEAMEQQTVTIAKAGIHASLNARCSVLAAANPVYGQYDRRRRIQENIGLPDSLLSRFDLLFVVLDQMDPESDRRIASHVIKGHQTLVDAGAGGQNQDGEDSDDDANVFHSPEDSRVHSIWQRDQHLVPDSDNDAQANEILQHDFLRKFLHFAKTRHQPTLTDSARDFIANRYAEMRARQDDRTLPVTARSLETVIRLATAHAKARLSKTVEAEPDCVMAMDILSFALYHESNYDATNGKKQNHGNTLGVKRAVVSDDSDTESETIGAENSRQRRRTESDGAENLRQQIMLQIDETGSLDLNAIPDSLLDQADDITIRAAVQAFVNEERLHLADDVAYIV